MDDKTKPEGDVDLARRDALVKLGKFAVFTAPVVSAVVVIAIVAVAAFCAGWLLARSRRGAADGPSPGDEARSEISFADALEHHPPVPEVAVEVNFLDWCRRQQEQPEADGIDDDQAEQSVVVGRLRRWRRALEDQKQRPSIARRQHGKQDQYSRDGSVLVALAMPKLEAEPEHQGIAQRGNPRRQPEPTGRTGGPVGPVLRFRHRRISP